MEDAATTPYRTAADPLGPVESVHGVTRGGLVGKAVLESILPLLAAAAMATIALAEGEPHPLARILPALVGIGLVGIAVWRLRVVSGLRLERVTVHQEGVRHERPGERTDLRWEDIERLTITFGEAPFDRKRPYHRIHTAGRSIELTDVIPDLRALFDTMAEKIVARRLPALQGAISEGETVRIGEVALRSHDVDLGGTVLRWSQVDEVTIEGGSFHVVPTARAYAPRRPVADLISASLLLELSDRLMATAPKDANE